jgi:hypothetical protein
MENPFITNKDLLEIKSSKTYLESLKEFNENKNTIGISEKEKRLCNLEILNIQDNVIYIKDPTNPYFKGSFSFKKENNKYIIHSFNVIVQRTLNTELLLLMFTDNTKDAEAFFSKENIVTIRGKITNITSDYTLALDNKIWCTFLRSFKSPPPFKVGDIVCITGKYKFYLLEDSSKISIQIDDCIINKDVRTLQIINRDIRELWNEYESVKKEKIRRQEENRRIEEEKKLGFWSQENYNTIYTGMTKSQVKRFLGDPDRNSSSTSAYLGTMDIWHYSGGTITFVNGYVWNKMIFNQPN